MKNTKLLVLLPAMLLTSCGGNNYGKKLTEEEAQPKMKAVTENTTSVKSLSAYVTSKTEAYVSAQNAKATVESKIKIDHGATVYFWTKIASGGQSLTTEVTLFSDVNYTNALYVSVSDGKNSQVMTVTKTSSQYTTLKDSLTEGGDGILNIVNKMKNPASFITSSDFLKGYTASYEFTYYADGDKTFTIVAKPDGKQVKGTVAMTYENALLSRYKCDIKTSDGSYTKEDSKLDYKGDVSVKKPSSYGIVVTY